jgi:hypothetical protein
MSRENLHLTIDHLVLPDMPPSQRTRIVEIIEQELGRLWVTLKAAQVEVAAGTDVPLMGRQVAHAIYGQLSGQQHSSPDGERSKL